MSHHKKRNRRAGTEKPTPKKPPSQKPSAAETKPPKPAVDSKKRKTERPKTTRTHKREKREKLPPGRVLAGPKGRYTITAVLGCGGFGDVYRVEEEKGGKAMALKTEARINDKPKTDKLKIEIEVMEACMAAKQKDHFIQFFDVGRTEDLVFIVMSLVGPSIDDLRRHVLHRDAFSQSTAVNISLQTLEAVRDLHAQCGYLHRDIKPHNFAIGLAPEKQTVVYMLDFGIARSFYADKNNKQIARPRDSVRFIGTLRYAPRSCHLGRDQARKDDLEAWLYLSYELFSKDTLVWRRLVKKDEIGNRKKEFFENACKHEADPVYKNVPAEYHKQLRYVDALTYYDEPNYADVHRAILTAAERHGIDKEAPLDWIGKDLAAAMAQKNRGKDTREDLLDDDDPFDRKKGTKGTRDTRELNEPDDKRKPDGEDGDAAGRKSTVLMSLVLPK